VRQRDFIVEHETPERRVLVVANPIAFDRLGETTQGGAADTEAPTRSAAPPPRWPTLGQDTDRVLAERLGLDPQRIAALRAAGVVA
jgi:crotonobetainyl-CoA:carnitine CoA-transferase CaiB-like acyl-CoA transferase